MGLTTVTVFKKIIGGVMVPGGGSGAIKNMGGRQRGPGRFLIREYGLVLS